MFIPLLPIGEASHVENVLVHVMHRKRIYENVRNVSETSRIRHVAAVELLQTTCIPYSATGIFSNSKYRIDTLKYDSLHWNFIHYFGI